MSSYLSCLDFATLSAFEDEVTVSPQVMEGLTGMIAVRAGEVIDPAVAGPDAGALVVAPRVAVPIVSGQTLMFCHPVVAAPAVVRRTGAVQAGGWLPNYVRLGVLEPYLGEGAIEAIIADAVTMGQVNEPKRRRAMSLALTARFTLAMVLMPEADYRETMRALVGHLAGVPWARPWQVPSSKVFTTWRRLLGEQAMEAVFWRAAGSIVDPACSGAAAAPWCGLELCAIDGFQIDLPDTAANRAAFGSSGAADDSAPFPQVRVVLVSARAGRAVLGAAMDASSVGEQTLIARLVLQRPDLFAGRVFLVDRNFLGHELITAIVDAGGHLVMRVKAGIALPTVGWLADGSRMSYLNAPSRKKADRLPVRVVEHTVLLPGTETVSELYCLATTLLDHQAFPAEAISEAYPQRWSAAETTIGENKSTVTGAGPSVGPILRSGEPALVRQELWAWLAATQLVRKAAAAGATETTGATGATGLRVPRNAPATAPPRAPKPAGTDQISFTTIRREVIRSLIQTQVTATTSPRALAALAEVTSKAALAHVIVTGRQRYSARRQKNRPSFPHTRVTTPTVAGPVQITRYPPGHLPGRGAQAPPSGL